MLRILLITSVLSSAALCSPSGLDAFQSRASDDNIVSIYSKDNFCMIMPRDPHTDIGTSEHPGGMQTYCSAQGHYSSQQGKLPDDFWSYVKFEEGLGKNGKKYVQLTGCIRPAHFSQLNAGDDGGQYDSSGGAKGRGNPEGSICQRYNHYIEIVEPAGPRACIRCCDDPVDCPTNKDVDKDGCPKVIPGSYSGCA
ncbi:hypothetical protein C8F04DRAFT_1031406 [Mycena alexandri]|uniref:Effector protein n=1 Tax=Mycena alexandri TaxID=1745969 RepID=A0AAD6T942_9AGAR|nr:hypothetical protein C8F04DRAFT_1031406 [Mycena alexandri]